MLAPLQPAGPMIPVRFESQPTSAAPTNTSAVAKDTLGGGACILDVEGKGEKDIVVMSAGDTAIRIYKAAQNGAMQEIPAQQTGLAVSGRGVACAVGDYDNDGQPDLAVALGDRVVLFHNHRTRQVRRRNQGPLVSSS